MKNQMTFTSTILLVLFLSACGPTQPERNATATAYIATSDALKQSYFLTQTAEPTAISLVMPKGDFEMSWNTYNSQYNTLGGILTIRKQGSKYTEKVVMSDGSSAIYDLTLISEGSEIKLAGHLGITSSLYGDYMVIRSTGELAFYDDQGYIYGVPPLK